MATPDRRGRARWPAIDAAAPRCSALFLATSTTSSTRLASPRPRSVARGWRAQHQCRRLAGSSWPGRSKASFPAAAALLSDAAVGRIAAGIAPRPHRQLAVRSPRLPRNQTQTAACARRSQAASSHAQAPARTHRLVAGIAASAGPGTCLSRLSLRSCAICRIAVAHVPLLLHRCGAFVSLACAPASARQAR